MLFAREVSFLHDHADVLKSPAKMESFRRRIGEGDVFIAKNVLPREKLLKVREYLERVGRSSLPNYAKIEEGCPNFHRLNDWDERAYVKGCFRQFSFFPWNQDVFRLFEMSKDVFRMRNLLSGLSSDQFLGRKPEDGCTARLSFQFYPGGGGGLNRHVDPYDFHQYVVPIVILSKKGVDYRQGGAYVIDAKENRIDLDEQADIGDVVYFSSLMPHGVDPVDPGLAFDWDAFQGRWIMLVAVNRLAGNAAIADSADLSEKSSIQPG